MLAAVTSSIAPPHVESVCSLDGGISSSGLYDIVIQVCIINYCMYVYIILGCCHKRLTVVLSHDTFHVLCNSVCLIDDHKWIHRARCALTSTVLFVWIK